MNLWTRRVLGTLPIVGCGAGMGMLALAWKTGERSAEMLAVMAFFAAIYVFGAVAGLMLLQGHRRAIAVNFFYWLLQTVQLSAVQAVYWFWTPVSLIAWWDQASSSGRFSAEVGSMFRLSLSNAGAGVAIGVNLFAVLCCVLLLVNRRRAAIRTDIDDDAIRAALSMDTAGFGRSRLPEQAAGHSGCVRIVGAM